MRSVYSRALVPIAAVTLVVLTVGGAALALLSDVGSSTGAETLDGPAEVLFEVGEAGTVLVRSTGDSLFIVDASATDLWRYDIAAGSGDRVGVDFVDPNMRIGFEAMIEEGAVVGLIRISSVPSALSDADAPDSGRTFESAPAELTSADEGPSLVAETAIPFADSGLGPVRGQPPSIVDPLPVIDPSQSPGNGAGDARDAGDVPPSG